MSQRNPLFCMTNIQLYEKRKSPLTSLLRKYSDRGGRDLAIHTCLSVGQPDSLNRQSPCLLWRGMLTLLFREKSFIKWVSNLCWWNYRSVAFQWWQRHNWWQLPCMEERLCARPSTKCHDGVFKFNLPDNLDEGGGISMPLVFGDESLDCLPRTTLICSPGSYDRVHRMRVLVGMVLTSKYVNLQVK